ncbi:MAG: TolC family protein [Sulfurovum sp.]
MTHRKGFIIKTSLLSTTLSLLLLSSTSLLANDLKSVLTHALENHPNVKERLSNYEKTVYDLKISKSEYLPTLDYVGRFGYERTLDQVGSILLDGRSTYENSLILTQNIFNGLKTMHRVEYEEARAMAAAYNYVEQTNDVAYNIVRNYINLLKFTDLYNLEKENVSLTRKIFDKTKELTDSGSETISNLKKLI